MSTASPPPPAGLVLEPFRALRFADDARDAAPLSPPYDLMSADQVKGLRRGLHSMVRLTRPVGEEGGYASAAAQLRRWREDGTLLLDGRPALYVYEIAPSRGPRVCGLLGALHLAQAGAGIVLPHEDTMAEPVADRLALLEATETDLEPIFLLYDGGPAVASAIASSQQTPPLTDAVTPDGVRHRLWSITQAPALHAIATEILPRHALIADGHHRYATYLSHQAAHWSRGDGPGPWDAGLAFLVDANRAGPTVEPIHRLLTEIGLDLAVARAAAVGRTRAVPSDAVLEMLLATDPTRPAFGLGAGSRAVVLDQLDQVAVDAALPAGHGPAWRQLDVAALHSYVIPVVLGLTDDDQQVRADHNANRALAAAARLDGTAVLLRPTAASAVLAVASAGERMPRKSTLFTPKPASGLVLRPLEPLT